MSSWLRMLATGAVTVAVDQATKALAVASIERGDRVNVFFGIDLVNVRNRGIAFGAFEDGGLLVVLLAAAALVALLAYFAFHARTERLWLPVGMVLGGAVANLIDRARLGAVVDFIDPIAWPAFNVADVAIVLGVFGVLYVIERPARSREPAP